MNRIPNVRWLGVQSTYRPVQSSGYRFWTIRAQINFLVEYLFFVFSIEP